MASSISDEVNDINYSGFKQVDDNNIIGNALNEGYTELLNARFYEVNYDEIAYIEEVRMARMLELFFEDKKEMVRGTYEGFYLRGWKHLPR
jgi:hypothetical protein